jgi:uncharacterized protein YcnI
MRNAATSIATIGALLLPAAAQAHISIHPNTIPAGAFATLDVRVPGEQEGAYVKKVDMLLPAGFTSVDYENVPGWSAHVVTEKLASPIQTDGGPVSEEVSQIVWTWVGPLGRVDNNQFVDFPLSVAIPANLAGQALAFKTVQTYSNGQVVHWIEPSLEAEHPAPTVNITAKGGAIQDIAGDEAGPRAGQVVASAPSQASATTGGGGASKGLAVAALVVGALGLIAGLAALAVSRRKRPPAGGQTAGGRQP